MVRETDSRDSHPELPDDPDQGPLSAQLIALVGLGGALGTAARYGFERWLPANSGLPRGTLIANLIGALILGVMLEALARGGPDVGARRKVRLLLGTGFCGGLTTYSTLAVEADLLIRSHRDALAAGYAVGSVLIGVALAGIGIALATRVRGRST
jgi:fluoride exporter